MSPLPRRAQLAALEPHFVTPDGLRVVDLLTPSRFLVCRGEYAMTFWRGPRQLAKDAEAEVVLEVRLHVLGC
jgi:hypothetical protein